MYFLEPSTLGLVAIPQIASWVGHALAWGWLTHMMMVFLQSLAGLHVAYFFAYAYLAARRRPPGSTFRKLKLLGELYFCLLNPLAYLLILVRTSSDAVVLNVQPSWLDPVAWLRFTSVYLNFRTNEEFRDALEEIEALQGES